jgi:hypothetical protein
VTQMHLVVVTGDDEGVLGVALNGDGAATHGPIA